MRHDWRLLVTKRYGHGHGRTLNMGTICRILALSAFDEE
jgi:hypothetical protein